MNILNFILNQLGFIVLVIIIVFIYKGVINLNLYSGAIIIAIFAIIYVSSELVWKSLGRKK